MLSQTLQFTPNDTSLNFTEIHTNNCIDYTHYSKA